MSNSRAQNEWREWARKNLRLIQQRYEKNTDPSNPWNVFAHHGNAYIKALLAKLDNARVSNEDFLAELDGQLSNKDGENSLFLRNFIITELNNYNLSAQWDELSANDRSLISRWRREFPNKSSREIFKIMDAEKNNLTSAASEFVMALCYADPSAIENGTPSRRTGIDLFGVLNQIVERGRALSPRVDPVNSNQNIHPEQTVLPDVSRAALEKAKELGGRALFGGPQPNVPAQTNQTGLRENNQTDLLPGVSAAARKKAKELGGRALFGAAQPNGSANEQDTGFQLSINVDPDQFNDLFNDISPLLTQYKIKNFEGNHLSGQLIIHVSNPDGQIAFKDISKFANLIADVSKLLATKNYTRGTKQRSASQITPYISGQFISPANQNNAKPQDMRFFPCLKILNQLNNLSVKNSTAISELKKVMPGCQNFSQAREKFRDIILTEESKYEPLFRTDATEKHVGNKRFKHTEAGKLIYDLQRNLDRPELQKVRDYADQLAKEGEKLATNKSKKLNIILNQLLDVNDPNEIIRSLQAAKDDPLLKQHRDFFRFNSTKTKSVKLLEDAIKSIRANNQNNLNYDNANVAPRNPSGRP